jgi:O-methyltransferase
MSNYHPGVTSGLLSSGIKALTLPLKAARFAMLHRKYRDFTMIERPDFIANLLAVSDVRGIPGCVIECGVWRGGMSAAMAEVLGLDRQYFLFDSFEGLPPAQDIDGEEAKRYQADKSHPKYYDNCRAEQSFAEQAMKLSGAKRYQLIKGWFNQTLPEFRPPEPIAVLRIDGDWYDSVLVCLRSLARYLAPGGVVILDDYLYWEGCSKATHQFLAETQSTARIVRTYRRAWTLRGLSGNGQPQPAVKGD